MGRRGSHAAAGEEQQLFEIAVKRKDAHCLWME
jgi:hypothetical protein